MFHAVLKNQINQKRGTKKNQPKAVKDMERGEGGLGVGITAVNNSILFFLEGFHYLILMMMRLTTTKRAQ